jgi:Xaa-Pro aminopeptidase
MTDRNKLLNKAYNQKLKQTLKILNGNLLLMDLHGDYDNPNIQMFLLDGIRTRPVAIMIKDSGESAILIADMEKDGVIPLNNSATIKTYKKTSDFYNMIYEFFSSDTEVHCEISDISSKFEHLTPSVIKKLSEKLKLKNADDILFDLRSIKTETEISLINKAIGLTNEILDNIEPDIKENTSEMDIYQLLSHQLAYFSVKFSFEPIIASGSRSANPHPIPHTDRILKKGDYMLLDFGIKYEGYCSDITRQYIIGQDIRDSEFFRYNDEMEKALTEEPVEGLLQEELGKRIKAISEINDLSKYEKHSYGHGLGVVVHDIFPLISTSVANFKDRVIKNNMIFTFEPGFYGDFGGFRIENDYIVKDGYARKLSGNH